MIAKYTRTLYKAKLTSNRPTVEPLVPDVITDSRCVYSKLNHEIVWGDRNYIKKLFVNESGPPSTIQGRSILFCYMVDKTQSFCMILFLLGFLCTQIARIRWVHRGSGLKYGRSSNATMATISLSRFRVSNILLKYKVHQDTTDSSYIQHNTFERDSEKKSKTSLNLLP